MVTYPQCKRCSSDGREPGPSRTGRARRRRCAPPRGSFVLPVGGEADADLLRVAVRRADVAAIFPIVVELDLEVGIQVPVQTACDGVDLSAVDAVVVQIDVGI